MDLMSYQSGPSSKRFRTSTGVRGAGLSQKQKGQIASIKFSKIGPWSEYGAARIKRGQPFSVENFGPSWKEATQAQKDQRKSTGYTGRGRYNLKNFGHDAMNVFRTVSRSGGVKGMAQSFAGTGLYTQGSGLYTGSGLYATNNLIATEGARPSMTFESPNDETQSLILTHKEYVSDIFGPATAAFTNTSYAINPGLSQNFPFLAQFAANFDEYELIQMIYEFHSTVDASSTNNTSGNTGNIIMATNYKSDAQPFLTKEEMIQYHGGVSGRLTDHLVHAVECDPKKNAMGGSKFTRSTPVANSDIKTYDSGVFQLAVQNCPTPFINNQIGELWVHYKVKLSKPKLTTALGNASTAARFVTQSGPTFPKLFGDTLVSGVYSKYLRAYNNNFSCLINDQVSGKITITFPANLSGVFEMTYRLEGAGTANNQILSFTPVDPVYAGQVTAWNDMYGTGASGGLTTPTNVASTVFNSNSAYCGSLSYTVRVKVLQATSGTENQLTFTPLGSAGAIGTGLQASIEILEIGSQFQQSNSIQAPQYVNSTGSTVTP